MVKTKRTFLRNFQLEDLNDLYEYAKVPGVGEMAGWKHHQSIEESKKLLGVFIANPNVYAIVSQENNRVIGSFSLKNCPEEIEETFAMCNCVEFGFTIAKEYWGRGIMPEVVNAVVEHLFINTNVNLITIEYFIENTQSEKVIKKCGGIFYKNDEYNSVGLGKIFKTKRYLIEKDKRR